MKALIQKVNYASLKVENKEYSKIGNGLLVLLGIEVGDTDKDFQYIKNKIIKLRIFEDENQKMNLSVKDVSGEIMLVSQFTLCTDCKSGNRPGFTQAEKPEIADEIYKKMINEIKNEGINVATGKFGSYMKIYLENDGPTTIMLESRT